jgi:hypothetical protein
MEGELAQMVFTDPPYNVPIDGHVCGSGRIRHREFAMGVGEMSQDAFTGFLADALKPMAASCRDGAIAFVCMDWRHMTELLNAGAQVFSGLKNLCVWNKTNGGMGTFYRSKHELVFAYKVGTAPHTNTFGLGDTGRYRTNVWDYAGISSMGATRAEDLAMHPTVKPVAMVADAIRDCSKRGDVVAQPTQSTAAASTNPTRMRSGTLVAALRQPERLSFRLDPVPERQLDPAQGREDELAQAGQGAPLAVARLHAVPAHDLMAMAVICVHARVNDLVRVPREAVAAGVPGREEHEAAEHEGPLPGAHGAHSNMVCP